MGYTALYRTFRPMTFGEMVGQEHITKTIKNQIINDRVGHAYLFNGGRGTGKTTTAKILARAMNCLNPKDGEPCNECEICKSAIEGSLTDLVEMDAASNNSVEDVREIREAVNFLPTKAKYRVYIIDEVHMLSTGAFNALLKTLEEPPKHVKFILATTEPQKIPATILSRCQRFDFKRVSNEDIIKRLKIVCNESKIEITDNALNLIAVLAEGGMRDALSILERCNQDGDNEITEEKIRDLVGIPALTSIKQISEGILNTDAVSTLNIVENVLKEGKDINQLLLEVMKYVKDILVFKSTGKAEIYSKEEVENINKIADLASKEELIKIICDLSELENKMRMSTQKSIIFEAGIIKLCNRNAADEDAKEQESSKTSIKTDDIQTKKLEERVTKIENFLKAGNFVTIKQKDKKEKKEIPAVPKYEGKVQDYWPKIVNDFKEQGKRVMSMNLQGTVAKEINDMTIVIEFPNGLNSMAKSMLEAPSNKQELKNMIHMACGKEMQIRFVDTKPQEENMQNSFEAFLNKSNINFNITE